MIFKTSFLGFGTALDRSGSPRACKKCTRTSILKKNCGRYSNFSTRISTKYLYGKDEKMQRFCGSSENYHVSIAIHDEDRESVQSPLQGSPYSIKHYERVIETGLCDTQSNGKWFR